MDGSIPNCWEMGNRMGAMMSRMADGSMKFPAMSKRMFTTSKKPQAGRPQPTMSSAMWCGMRSVVSTWAKIMALAMMKRSITLTLVASSSTLRTWGSVVDLGMAARMIHRLRRIMDPADSPGFFQGVFLRGPVPVHEHGHEIGVDRGEGGGLGGAAYSPVDGAEHDDDEHDAAQGREARGEDLAESGPGHGRKLLHPGGEVDGQHQRQPEQDAGHETGHDKPPGRPGGAGG